MNTFLSKYGIIYSLEDRNSKGTVADLKLNVDYAVALSKIYNMEVKRETELGVDTPLDRLLHHAETILIEGKSYRMKEQIEV